MRLIDADALKDRMYHDAFETDTDMQKWDSGCWIRYKMFENAIEEAPTIEPSADEYVPHKACFDCMERGTGMCKGTIQEQSWCPIVAKTKAEPNKMSVNVEYDVEYLPDKDGVHQAKATITKAEPKCETCRHNDEEWYSTACDSCCGSNSHYEPSGDLISREAEQTIIGIDIPYGSDKGLATVFKGKDDKLILEKVKEICLDDFTDRPSVSIQPKAIANNCDLISREEAIKAVMAEGRNVHASEYANAERIIHEADAVEALAMLPSADTAPVVAYICDRRRCAICRGKDGGCDHTTDIKHAAHFKNVAGQYFERPYMEEEEDGDL